MVGVRNKEDLFYIAVLPSNGRYGNTGVELDFLSPLYLANTYCGSSTSPLFWSPNSLTELTTGYSHLYQVHQHRLISA